MQNPKDIFSLINEIFNFYHNGRRTYYKVFIVQRITRNNVSIEYEKRVTSGGLRSVLKEQEAFNLSPESYD